LGAKTFFDLNVIGAGVGDGRSNEPWLEILFLIGRLAAAEMRAMAHQSFG
jgi:hypothetical protein